MERVPLLEGLGFFLPRRMPQCHSGSRMVLLKNIRIFATKNIAENRFLAPNTTVSTMLAIECILIIIFLPESFQRNQSGSANADPESTNETTPLIPPPTAETNPIDNTRNVLFVIFSYALFELSWISYTLYFLVYKLTPKPIGAGLNPMTFSLTILIPGLTGLLLQFFTFNFFITKFGIIKVYSTSFLLVSIIFFITPFISFEGIYFKIMITLEIIRVFAHMVVTSSSLILICSPCFLANNTLGTWYLQND
jgi:hypothetical protein